MNTFKKIHIDFSTYLLLLLAMLAGYFKNVALILTIVIIHELGHVFFFNLFNIDIERITIYPCGGLTIVNKHLHERIYKEIIISLGGIIFQIILMVLFYFLYRHNYILDSTFKAFCLYNQNIILFNLIPLIPLDGSKLLLAILTKFCPFKTSYITMIIIGLITLILFIGYNFVYKINDLIIYIFLISQLLEIIKNYKYVINQFYLERILYKHYYNQIINEEHDIKKMRLDKYYYFYQNASYINEQDYLKRYYFKS